jgi:hypothetical protein
MSANRLLINERERTARLRDEHLAAQREIERLREALEEMEKLAEHLYDGGRVNRENGWAQRWSAAMDARNPERGPRVEGMEVG